MKKVLLFFSGGNDSTLSACILASKGYDVNLITFDNGCEEGIENVKNRATILERRFPGKVHNLGVFQSVSVFMDMRYQSVNMNFSKIIEKYGNLNQNQINCLNCRSAMYVIGTVVARRLGVKYIAEGARKTQLFALEQKEILQRYSKVLGKYGIELLLPVVDYERDYDVETDLWLYLPNSYDKVYEDTLHYEAKCFLGCPMDRPLTNEELEGYAKFFDEVINSTMIERIDTFPKMPIDEQLEHPSYTRYRFK